MNKKFLAIIAASAALGSAIFATPARAVDQEVNVNVTIQPSLYLRTFKNIDLNITDGDLQVPDKDFGPDAANQNTTTNGKTALDVIAPIVGGGRAVDTTIKVNQLFAVWSNTDRQVKVMPTIVQPNLTQAGGTVTTTSPRVVITEVQALASTDGSGTGAAEVRGAATNRIPFVGGAVLKLDLSASTRGAIAEPNGSLKFQGGIIRVEALPDV
jgi:hypothetical protein